MKKILLTLAIAGLFTNIGFAADNNSLLGANNKPIIIRLSHVVKDNAPKELAAEAFKQEMESKFPNRVKVEIYSDNKLFKDKEETEALELGAVDVILPTSGKISSYYGVKEFELFDLPFLFDNTEEILKFTQSDSGQKLLNFLNNRNKNVVAITYWPNDFRNFNGSKFFKTPDDFKGLTARTENEGIMKSFYDALGVKETITLPFSELPSAFSKKGEYKVDVASNPNTNYYTAKLYENAKYVTLSQHDVNTYVFLTNKRWFNSLPDDIKTGFVQAAKDSGVKNFEIAQQEGVKELNLLKQQGVQVYTWSKEEKEQFKKKAIFAHENYLKNINEQFLNEVYRVVK